MAGTTLGFLKFVLGFDSISFKKGMTQSERDLVLFQKKIEGVGKSISNAGKVMTIGLTAPLVAFGAKSFDVAKDAVELDSAFEQTFGNMAKSMDAWAVATGNAMGRSTREIKEGANTFGLFFNQAAKTRVEAGKLSQQFTVLAQDLASFHNTGVDEALLALRSGLSGEAEPMRKYGVFLNEAAVSAKAAELGFKGVNGKLSDQEKIMARAAIILEKTKTAQGDVGRTADSAANQIRRSQAAWEELQITVGTKVIPLLTPLIEKLGTLLTKFNELDPSTQNWVLGIAAVSAVVGPILIGLGSLISLLAKIVPLMKLLQAAFIAVRIAALATLPALTPFLVPLGAMAVAIGAVYLAWRNWDKISAIVSKVYAAVKTWLLDKLNAVWESVRKKIEAVTGFFQKMYDAVVGHSYVPDMVDGIQKQMARLETVMVAPVKKATEKTKAAFEQLKADVGPLLDRLYPQAAANNQYLQDVKTLEAAMKSGIITAHEYADALSRLTSETLTKGPELFDGKTSEQLGEEMSDGIDIVLPKLEELGEEGKRTTSEMIEGFGRMAVSTIDAARSMAQAFKSGDILGGIQMFLELVMDVLRTLGQIGIIPGMTTPPYGGGRAAGGPIVPGKSYLVGENGPELVTPNRRGYVHPNGEMGGAHITVVPSKYFDVVVDRRAQLVAAPIAGQAAVLGMAGAETRQYRRGRRTIP